MPSLKTDNIMVVEQNKLSVLRYYAQIVNKGEFDLADELFAQDFCVSDPSNINAPTGPEGIKHLIRELRTAFPDIHVTVGVLIGEVDMIAARIRVRGCHIGEYKGFAPTRRTISINGLVLFRFQGGKIREQWINRDDLGMMQQLGLLPMVEQIII